MTKLYVTYGCGTNLADCFSVIEAPSMQECYDKLQVIEGKYSFTYDSDHFVGHAEKYGLTEVPLQKMIYTGGA